MDPYQTHGAFSWSELTTSDPAKAGAFYAALFGWKVDTMDMGTGPYHVVKAGDASVGGIMGPPPGAPAMPPAWVPYVTVTDVDATAKQCTELGGKLLVPPMDIPTVGRMAVLQDPQGATINVITYGMG
jgi:predicted enzyme related to lactoylglutathione lyase